MNTMEFAQHRANIIGILNNLSEGDIKSLCRYFDCTPHYNDQSKSTHMSYLFDEILRWRKEADQAERYREGLRLLGLRA